MNSFFASRTSRVTDPDPAAGRIDQQLARLDRLIETAMTTAEDGGDPALQLRILERLLDMVIGTEFGTPDPVGGHVGIDEDDDRQSRVQTGTCPICLADRPQGVEAGVIHECKVEDQQIGAVVMT